MTWIAVTVAVLYGLVVGSFLNVAIHRVPVGRSVVRPGSACPTCGNAIAARDNVPLLSWVLLHGRCRHCAEPISARYPAVELLTGVLFGAVAVRFGWSWELPAYCALVAGLVAVSAVDLDCRRIPTRMLQATAAAGFPFLVVAATSRSDLWPLARAALGALGCFAVMLVIHLISPRGMGFGDVRLATLLGGFLGWLGPAHPALGLFLGFLAGSVVGIALMAVRRAGRRSAIPFGPYLAGGGLVTVLWGDAIIDLYTGLGT